MKFSVLLPTRNRLEYLRYAVSSVLEQDYDHWEIIISDNDSEEDIKGYVVSLADARIRYYRTESFCSVTDNWNNALEKATGDYIIMLGDDDCLLRGYFSLSIELINQQQFPDLIYSSALIYAYPGVAPDAPQGYLMQCGYAAFLVKTQAPVILDPLEVQCLVKEMMNFNVSVNFNPQHSLMSRKLIEEMQKFGKFYQSPYPDYYSTISLFLMAKRVLAVPYPMVVIGITPKSFGSYYMNNNGQHGEEYLKSSSHRENYKDLAKYIISGSEMNVYWLFSLESVRRTYTEVHSLKVNYKKFRFLQILHQCKKFACREGVQFKDMMGYWRHLFVLEKLVYFLSFLLALFIRSSPKNHRGKAYASAKAYSFSHPALGVPKKFAGEYKNIMDVFQQFKIND